jgi:translocation protein SEC72
MVLPSINAARTKNSLHAIQGFIIFLAWVLTIAVFTKGDGVDGRSGWYFGMCWLSIPALIYLVAVPLYPNARRFGNVYAFATIDCLFVILWFSAWVAVASYVAEGKSIGAPANNNKNQGTGCDNWAYGDSTKCQLSTVTVIFGVAIFFFSIRNVVHFRRTGTMPDAISDPTFAAQTKAAFSSNPVQDFDEEDEFRSGRAADSQPRYPQDRDDDYALLQQSEADDLGASHHGPAAQDTYDPTAHAPGAVMHDYDTSYGGAYGQHYHQQSDSYSGGNTYGSGGSGYGQ